MTSQKHRSTLKRRKQEQARAGVQRSTIKRRRTEEKEKQGTHPKIEYRTTQETHKRGAKEIGTATAETIHSSHNSHVAQGNH